MAEENKGEQGCGKMKTKKNKRVTDRAIGFEEKISISLDFDHTSIRIIQDDTSFSISGTAEKTLNDRKKEKSIHRFRYSRFFERTILKPTMRAEKGVVYVSGLFATNQSP